MKSLKIYNKYRGIIIVGVDCGISMPIREVILRGSADIIHVSVPSNLPQPTTVAYAIANKYQDRQNEVVKSFEEIIRQQKEIYKKKASLDLKIKNKFNQSSKKFNKQSNSLYKALNNKKNFHNKH
ncbi:MAG: hypothetical protein NTY12_00550 [Candidatus Falkowbacteria bacterium]|nr:hypothetical protein [Candidatus Falkowbacteria bacterium]